MVDLVGKHFGFGDGEVGIVHEPGSWSWKFLSSKAKRVTEMGLQSYSDTYSTPLVCSIILRLGQSAGAEGDSFSTTGRTALALLQGEPFHQG